MTAVRALLATLLLVVVAPATAIAAKPWPPANGPGLFFIHYGEEHWNDDDSDLTLPKVVAEASRYGPDLVTMSGDKANDGTVEQLARWKEIMSAYDRAGVKFFAGVGNHDRKAPPGVLPGTAGLLSPGVQGELTNYKDVFADRPYPYGDAAPYDDSRLSPSARPEGDPAGASSHYFVDFGNVRWVFVDNSCWGINDCDSVQNPPFPDAEGIPTQFDWLERKAREATDAGKVVFVVMHIPTQDPRDQSYIDTTSFNHVMGKGISPTSTADNATFEDVAERSGVDGVFVGHIKGQFLYEGRGDVPYYIDGGAGGELYTDGPVGVNHGYWHGFRLIRVDGKRITTDMVPIFAPGSIAIRGPEVLARGEEADFRATGKQLDKKQKPVGALTLQDPNPVRSNSSGAMAFVGELMTDGGGWIFIAPALLALIGLALRLDGPSRRLAGTAPAVALIAVGALGAVALAADDDEPTSTPKASLPNPARIWETGNRFVLQPVASKSEDPRRNPRTQTQDGAFRARCPGKTAITIASGFEESTKAVRVPSARGKLVRRIRFRGRGVRVRLAQAAEVVVRVRRGKRLVRTVKHGCFAPRTLRARWDRRIRRGGKLRRARKGVYRLELVVRSDRRPLTRRRKFSL